MEKYYDDETDRNKILGFFPALTALILVLIFSFANFNDFFLKSPNRNCGKHVNISELPLSSECKTATKKGYAVISSNVCALGSENYEFKIRPIKNKLFSQEIYTFNLNPKEFNNVIHEILYINGFYESYIKSYTFGMGKGFWNSVYSFFRGIFNLIFHPINSLSKIWDFLKSIPEVFTSVYKNPYSIILGPIQMANVHLDEKEKDIARKHNIALDRIYFPETINAIKHERNIEVAGEITGEAVLAYFAYKAPPLIGSRVTQVTEKIERITGQAIKNEGRIESGIFKAETKVEKTAERDLKLKDTESRSKTRTTKKEEEIYKKAEVSEPRAVEVDSQKVNVRQKNIDPDKEVTVREPGPDGKQRRVKKTNCDLMKEGKAPYDKDGTRIELHHNKQENVLTEGNGYFVELSTAEHRENDKDLHFREPKSEAEKKAFDKFRSQYWKMRYAQLCTK